MNACPYTSQQSTERGILEYDGISDSSVKITLPDLDTQPVSGDSFVSVKGKANYLY